MKGFNIATETAKAFPDVEKSSIKLGEEAHCIVTKRTNFRNEC